VIEHLSLVDLQVQKVKKEEEEEKRVAAFALGAVQRS
jgi:hypothetical protein